jgi:hypothetical protein
VLAALNHPLIAQIPPRPNARLVLYAEVDTAGQSALHVVPIEGCSGAGWTAGTPRHRGRTGATVYERLLPRGR